MAQKHKLYPGLDHCVEDCRACRNETLGEGLALGIVIALVACAFILAKPCRGAANPSPTPSYIGAVTISAQAVMLVRESTDPKALPVKVVSGKFRGEYMAVSVVASLAEPVLPAGCIPIRVVKVVDGDTLAVEFYPFPDVVISGRIRLLGVDCYETHAKTADKLALAKKGKEFTEGFLRDELRVFALVSHRDSFGRLLARVFIPNPAWLKGTGNSPWLELGEELVSKGLAIRGFDPSRF